MSHILANHNLPRLYMPQLNSILARDVTLSESDRPVHVQGCFFGSALAAIDTNNKGSNTRNQRKPCRLLYQQRHSGLIDKCPEREGTTLTSIRPKHPLSARVPPKRQGAKQLLPKEMKRLPTVSRIVVSNRARFVEPRLRGRFRDGYADGGFVDLPSSRIREGHSRRRSYEVYLTPAMTRLPFRQPKATVSCVNTR